MIEPSTFDSARKLPVVRVIALATVAAALAALSACKTTEGAGKDIENLGENIQDAAD